ncbi:hypothetical protein [Iamia sp.]|uniref:hypothetical protein n=1 Tax=Iamia sp. TaxID=2722710 RepID=UPI002C3B1072|nr:hypothetical protein [Iamia sp.]HXH57929.1 hypothetical protein [Iamia sp.]
MSATVEDVRMAGAQLPSSMSPPIVRHQAPELALAWIATQVQAVAEFALALEAADLEDLAARGEPRLAAIAVDLIAFREGVAS